MSTMATYQANRWVDLAPIQVDAYDAENGIVQVQVQLIASEAGQTLNSGARNAKIKFISNNRNKTVTYTPPFGSECENQLLVHGPLADVQAALGGVAFQTTEYGAVMRNGLSVEIQDVFSQIPTYKDIARSELLINLDPACDEALPSALISSQFSFIGQKIAVELIFNGILVSHPSNYRLQLSDSGAIIGIIRSEPAVYGVKRIQCGSDSG